MKLSPSTARIAVLIIELMTFFIVTVVLTYFISYAGAPQILPGEATPPPFPVIAYDGDPKQADPKHYFVVPWSEWNAVSGKRPGASLLLPERSGRVRLADGGQATFSSSPEGEGRQSIELTWVYDGGERHVQYLAQARTIEPRYFRAVTTHTFLIGAIAGFIAGLFVGRTLRRRWLAQPGFYAPGVKKD